MAPATQAKAVDKKSKRRGASQSPKTRSKGEVKDENSPKSGLQSSVSADSLIKAQTATHDESATLSASQSRPLVESTKCNTDKKGGDGTSPSSRKRGDRNEKGSPTVPKAPRAMRRDRPVSLKQKQEGVKADEEAGTVASKVASFEQKASVPVVSATSSARRDSIKGKREAATTKNSPEIVDETKNLVRFQTESIPVSTLIKL